MKKKLEILSTTEKNRPEFNPISYLLSITATLGMFIIAIYFWKTNLEWAKFSFLQFIFGICGIISLNIYKNKRFFPPQLKSLNVDHIYTSLITYTIILIVQVVGGLFQLYYSPANIVEIMYTTFSSICEELFFRGTLLGLFIYIARGYKKHIIYAGLIISSGLFLSALMFMSAHINYYNNPIILITVFIGGLVLGISYIKTCDIMVPILAHFMLNLSVILQGMI